VLVRLGSAGLGRALQGSSNNGCKWVRFPLLEIWCGRVRLGAARQGKAWQGIKKSTALLIGG